MTGGARSILLVIALGAATLGPSSGCAKTWESKQQERQRIDTALEAYVLDSIPSDLENRTYIDFEGKMHLIGYALEPKEVAPPGSQVKLTLYWQSLSPLGRGWQLFTHLLGPGGEQIPSGNVDNVGPLRQLKPAAAGEQAQTLPPSAWQPGKVYVDEQTFQIAPDVAVPVVTIAIGVWRPGGMRLDVISGPTDGHNRAIVAHLRTGVMPKAKASEASAKHREET
jgi:hypothetical protein